MEKIRAHSARHYTNYPDAISINQLGLPCLYLGPSVACVCRRWCSPTAAKLTRLQGEVFHDKMNDKKN